MKSDDIPVLISAFIRDNLSNSIYETTFCCTSAIFVAFVSFFV